jgi:hypothetical protein
MIGTPGRGPDNMQQDLPSLAALKILENVCASLDEAKANLTATRLIRTLEVDEQLFHDAIEFGITNRTIERLSRNYIRLLARPYTIKEESYYKTIKGKLEHLWLSEGYDRSSFHAEITARSNSKIEGPWTRPDLTLISHRKYPWTIGAEFDVVTFEVKRPSDADVLAVFEALSHLSVATRAYAVFPVNHEEWKARNSAQERRVHEECVRHGVGLILIENAFIDPEPVHLLKAPRREIDHEKSSAFLDAVMTNEAKVKISKWK